MKNLITAAVILTVIALSQGCKKDKKNADPPKTQTPAPVTYADFSQFKAGNYWIYQEFEIDAQGNETATNRFDSCYIAKDTLIRNQTYSKYVDPNSPYSPHYTLLRDSLQYIITASNVILFAEQDFSTVFYDNYNISNGDTISRIFVKMEDKDKVVATPAGSFTTSDLLQTQVMYGVHNNGFSPRHMHHRRAKNIGIVIETQPIYTIQTSVTERRLVRYHLNE